MRFPEPPRGKGGSAAAAPLSLPLLAGTGQTALPASVSQRGRGWRQKGEKQTESYGERPCSCWLQLWDVQPGFGVRSLLSSEHGLLSQACSWTEMVSCLLSWLLQQPP